MIPCSTSLRSRHLEVMGAEKKRARERDTQRKTPLACLPLAPRSFLRPLLPSAYQARYGSTLNNVFLLS